MAADSEALLQLLGRPGKFQILLFFILCTNYTTMVFNNINMALFGAKNPHHCRLPENVSIEDAVPQKLDQDGRVVFDSCRVYQNFSSYYGNETMPCPNGYVHFTEENEVTINTEFDLVCDQAYLSSLSTTIYFIGVMIGGVLFGNLSDLYGRRPVLLFCLWCQMALGVGLSFVRNYLSFVLVRFLLGIVLQGMQAVTVTMTMEFSQIRFRTVVGASLEVFWAIGIIYFALISYLVRDWHYIQLVLSLHSLVTLSYFWILPESIRWLATAQRNNAIVSTMTKLARLNCVRVDPEMVETHLNIGKPAPRRRYTCLDLVRTPVLRRRTVILCYVWFSCMLGYYGLTLSILKLTESKYMNMFISGAVELPAYVLSMYVLSKFGRRIPFCVFQISGGMICIVAGAIPRASEQSEVIATVMALVGKFALVGGFSVAFMYTGELYPTVLRTIGVGSSVFFARLGGVLAPQVNYLGLLTYQQLPVFLFGVFITISGCLSLHLPETLNRKLPDTVEEVEFASEAGADEDDIHESPQMICTTENSNRVGISSI